MYLWSEGCFLLGKMSSWKVNRCTCSMPACSSSSFPYLNQGLGFSIGLHDLLSFYGRATTKLQGHLSFADKRWGLGFLFVLFPKRLNILLILRKTLICWVRLLNHLYLEANYVFSLFIRKNNIFINWKEGNNKGHAAIVWLIINNNSGLSFCALLFETEVDLLKIKWHNTSHAVSKKTSNLKKSAQLK